MFSLLWLAKLGLAFLNPFQKRIAFIEREHCTQMAFCNVIGHSLFVVKRIQKFFVQTFVQSFVIVIHFIN